MKRRVNGITKVTNTPFLNMYTFDMLYENGKHGNYLMLASLCKKC